MTEPEPSLILPPDVHVVQPPPTLGPPVVLQADPPPGWRRTGHDPGVWAWAWEGPDGRLAYLTPGLVPDDTTILVGTPPVAPSVSRRDTAGG